MSSSLTQFANAAGLDLGVMDSGGAFSTQQYLDILAKANRILDNWSADQIQIPWAIKSSVAVTANTRLYSVGPGGANWALGSLYAPVKFVAAAHNVGGTGQITPVKIVSPVEWESIADRDVSANLIKYLFYQRGSIGTFQASAAISPAPLQNGTLELVWWDRFTQFADVSTPVTFPPGYERAFQLELALSIAPMFDETPSADLQAEYGKAMNALRKLNADLWGVDSLAPEQAAVKATE